MIKRFSIIFIVSILIISCEEEDKKFPCTDPDACNYNSPATSSDGSCNYICLTDVQKTRVINFVKEAIDSIRSQGEKDALEEFNLPNGHFVREELYIFAGYVYFFTEKSPTVIVASHPFNKDLIGKNVYDLKDLNDDSSKQKFPVRDMIDNIKYYGKGWSWYWWANPETEEIRKKFTYVQKYDHMIIGSGTYTE